MRTKQSFAEKVFGVCNIIFFVLFSITILFPFLQQITLSLSSPEAVLKQGLHLIPEGINFESYKRVFSSAKIIDAYYWTIVRCVLGTVLTVVVSAAVAYPLSKKYLPLRKFWLYFVVFTMFFSGGMIPGYFLIRDLKMLNTIWALVLPGMIDAYNVILMRNFFVSIPDSLEESGKIDGANEIYIFLKIILPLSTPILATIALWTIVGHWNSWFDALIYINNNKIVVLQTMLRAVIMEASRSYAGVRAVLQAQKEASERVITPQSVTSAVLCITTLPVLMIYPFLQKYFIKGIMIGSVKG